MPINYDVEYPKLQRKLSEAKRMLESTEQYLRHKNNCLSCSKKWRKGMPRLLSCDCGLTELTGK